MVIYYSLGDKTKAYAEKLAASLGDKTFRLEGVNKSKNAVLAAIAAIFTGGKVKELPIVKDDTLFVCAPVWAGGPAPFVAYFLKNTDVSGKKVHFLLTCSDASPSKYAAKLTGSLGKYGGKVWVFCSRDKSAVDEYVQSVVNSDR